MLGVDGLELHDPVTVWCAIQNPPVIDEAPGGPLLSNGWKVQMRRFQVERLVTCKSISYKLFLKIRRVGELTRGMLVVDHRQDGIFSPGDNRARVQEEGNVEKYRTAVVQTLEVDPREHQDELLMGVQDVAVVIDTPGPDVLVRAMLNRIWGLHI